MKKVTKMMTGIKVALELVEAGDYTINTDGTMFNKAGKKIGSLDKPSGNIFYVIKGVDILAHRLHYAYYHGYETLLDETKIVKHLDGCKQNNGIDNLVMVNRKGWKKELEAKRNGLNIEAVAVEAPQAPVVEEAPVQEPTVDLTGLNEKEQEAVMIWEALLEGHTIKEVAEKLNIKTSRVYDVKRKKSNADVTDRLPQLV